MKPKTSVRNHLPKEVETSANSIQTLKNGLEVWTLSETAAFLRVSEEEVQKHVVSGSLPGQKIGDEWRFLKPALLAWLGRTEPQSEKTYHERIMATAGCMADDDTAMEMLEKIYEERKKR